MKKKAKETHSNIKKRKMIMGPWWTIFCSFGQLVDHIQPPNFVSVLFFSHKLTEEPNDEPINSKLGYHWYEIRYNSFGFCHQNTFLFFFFLCILSSGNRNIYNTPFNKLSTRTTETKMTKHFSHLFYWMLYEHLFNLMWQQFGLVRFSFLF